MPDRVCKFCGIKASETYPIPGPGDVIFLVFECGSSVFSDGDSSVQTDTCKLSQRDQEIERLRKALEVALMQWASYYSEHNAGDIEDGTGSESSSYRIANQALAPR